MSLSEFRVYISSAIGDLAEEREHLYETIFPELRVLCRERGIIFTVVDLRLRLDSDKESPGDIIPLCFEEIDRCRPYFIGICGNEYGFVPELTHLRRQTEMMEKYKWLEDAAADEMSVMEMEFRYAALNPEWHSPIYDTRAASRRSGSTLIYFRRLRINDTLHEPQWKRGRLDLLQDAVRDAGLPMVEFRDHEMLGELIHHDLVEILRRDFAHVALPTPLDEERALHEAYSESLDAAYIANPRYVRRLNEHAADDTPPLVVYAESGSGKTALMVHWIDEYRAAHPQAFVVEHYCGATGGDYHAIVRHLMLEIRDRLNLEREIPETSTDVEDVLPSWLELVTEENLVVVIDGVNLLKGGGRDLGWLPTQLSPNIRLILTTTVEHSLVVMRERGWQQMGMQPLPVQLRLAVATIFLQQHALTLPVDLQRKITDDTKSASPLFLRVVLEELRRLASHRLLHRRIASYLDVTGVDDLFQRLLEHIEEDHQLNVVRDVLSLIWASRTGMTTVEVAELSGLSSLAVARLHRGISYYLVERNGMLNCFHEYLRRAIETRYLSNEEEKERIHALLAEYFQRQARQQHDILHRAAPLFSGRGEPVSHRRLTVFDRYAVERVFQRRQSELWRQLLASRAPLTFEESNLVEDVVEAGAEESVEEDVVAELPVEDSEQPGIGSYSKPEIPLPPEIPVEEPGLEPVVNENVEHSRRRRRRFDIERSVADAEGLMEIAERLRSAQNRFRDERSIASVRSGKLRESNGAGSVRDREHPSSYPEALERFVRHVAGMPTEERRGAPNGAVQPVAAFPKRGDFQRLIDCFHDDLEVSEEEGDAEGMAEAYCDLGIIYMMQGDHIRARECFGAALNVAEEMMDDRLIALAAGNLGLVCYHQGEYSIALEHLKRELDLVRATGDSEAVSVALGNIGIVYADQSEYTEALECFAEQFSIDEARGDREGMAIAIGNMGNVYRRKGEYRQVLRCFQSALEGARASGSPLSIAHWLLRKAQTLVDLVRASDPPPAYLAAYVRANEREVVLEEARENIKESISLSETVQSWGLHFESRLLLAGIEHALGAIHSAEEKLLALLRQAGNDDERAAAHYELWRLGTFISPETSSHRGDHADEAVRLYQSLYAQSPRLEYGRRIVELKSLRRQPLRRIG
jgi:nephrocystin-3